MLDFNYNNSAFIRAFILLYNQEQKKTQLFRNRFSHIYIYQNTPYYISNLTQLDELYDGENCIKKYFTINIFYDFKNDL